MGDAFDDLLSSLDELKPKEEHAQEHHEYGGHEDYSGGNNHHADAGASDDYSGGGYSEPVADFGESRHESEYVATPPPPPPQPSYSAPKPVKQAPSYGGGSSAPSYGGGGGGYGGSNSCGKCGSDVGGEHIKAMDKVWHVHHFTCNRCNKELRGGAFFVQNGQPECTNCVERSNPCSKCGRGITGQYLYSPQGEKWHTECVDKKSCAKCHQHVGETEISALGKHWHPHCFTCSKCHSQLSGNFVVKDDQPLCNNCSQASRPLCRKCGQGLQGDYVTFKGENLHNNCHTCVLCRKPLGVSGFYEVQGQPRCGDCVHK